MSTSKLNKGSLYCAIINGEVSFGTHLGVAGGFAIFRPSHFTFDYNGLEGAIPLSALNECWYVEIANAEEQANDPICKSEAMRRLQQKLE